MTYVFQQQCISITRNLSDLSPKVSITKQVIYIIASILLILLGLLDCLIRQPYGLISWHEFKGEWKTARRGPSIPCGWDYEGSWKIGIVHGTNPSMLNNGDQNPVFTCANVTGVYASFVADPFLVIPGQDTSSHGPESFYPSPTTGTIRTAMNTIVGDQYIHGRTRLAQSFYERQQSKKNKTNVVWYLFYELKNLERYIGEIGVAISMDYGHSWKHADVALSERFHLSYPFVIFYSQTHQYFMIPETYQNKSIRIYATTPEAFPFGWTLLYIPLTGAKYVDTSVIYYQQKYWIFTTIEYQLFVYYTSDLLSPWKAHRKNPVVQYNRAIGRSAGRVVIYDHYLWRYAQDCTRFYGTKVHVLRINLLTETEWSEELVNTIESIGNGSWNTYRLHHIDAHEMMVNMREENTHNDGNHITWLAMIDGDDKPYNYQFYIHEGWFIRLKRVIWCGVIAQFAIVMFLMFRTCWRLESNSSGLCKAFCNQLINLLIVVRSGLQYIIIHRQLLLVCSQASIRQLLLFLLKIGIIVAFTILITSLYPWCWDTRTGCDSGSKHNLVHTTNNLSNLNGFVIVTAASSLYFHRLRNLVGSVHFWEPNQRLVVYDIGLTEEELLEAQCWSHLEIRQFDFDLYPPHVKNLYNYAWKILMIDDALNYNESVLVLDAGAELRYSLETIKEYLVKHGYWMSTQSNIIDAKTNLQTFSKLDMKPELFIGKGFCSGGLQGYIRDSPAYKNVLKRAVVCALDESCIAPSGSGRSNHNFDQSVFSILMHYYGYRCEKDRKYKEMDMSHMTEDETRYNDIVIGLRRWHTPKPYVKYVRKFERCQTNPLKQKYYDLIEHTAGSHLESNSPLVQCLEQYKNDRKLCAALIVEHQQRNENSRLPKFEIMHALKMLKQCSSCYHTYVVFASILIIIWQLLSYRSGISRTSSMSTCFKHIRIIAILIVLWFLLIPIYHLSLRRWGTPARLNVF